MVKELRTRIPLIALCGVFIGLGMLLIPYAGIHNDEALFANPIYQNQFEFKIPLFGHNIPLMTMSYIGTVKTAFYWVLFKLWPPGLYSVRLPMVLLGAVTIYLFFSMAKRVSNAAGGGIAAILLAEGSEVFEGVRARLERQARGRALRKEILDTVEDTHGRPVFEIFRLSTQ